MQCWKLQRISHSAGPSASVSRSDWRNQSPAAYRCAAADSIKVSAVASGSPPTSPGGHREAIEPGCICTQIAATTRRLRRATRTTLPSSPARSISSIAVAICRSRCPASDRLNTRFRAAGISVLSAVSKHSEFGSACGMSSRIRADFMFVTPHCLKSYNAEGEFCTWPRPAVCNFWG